MDLENAKDNFRDKTWWVFCWNNPPSLEPQSLLKDVEEIWWQLEEGKKRHVPHLQGVVHFTFPKGIGALRERMPAWWSVMRGTVNQAVSYVTKDETRIAGPWHYVKPGAQAHLLKIEAINNPPNTDCYQVKKDSEGNDVQVPAVFHKIDSSKE